MPGWPEWFDNRPCQCPECTPGPGIDFRKSRAVRFMDERIQWFLEDGWKVIGEELSNGLGETEY